MDSDMFLNLTRKRLSHQFFGNRDFINIYNERGAYC